MSAPHHLVAFLIAHGAALDRLVDAHADDGSGHCRACTSGGQTGHLRFLHHPAVRARRAGTGDVAVRGAGGWSSPAAGAVSRAWGPASASPVVVVAMAADGRPLRRIQVDVLLGAPVFVRLPPGAVGVALQGTSEPTARTRIDLGSRRVVGPRRRWWSRRTEP